LTSNWVVSSFLPSYLALATAVSNCLIIIVLEWTWTGSYVSLNYHTDFLIGLLSYAFHQFWLILTSIMHKCIFECTTMFQHWIILCSITGKLVLHEYILWQPSMALTSWLSEHSLQTSEFCVLQQFINSKNY
jgi:hypothetical protein